MTQDARSPLWTPRFNVGYQNVGEGRVVQDFVHLKGVARLSYIASHNVKWERGMGEDMRPTAIQLTGTWCNMLSINCRRTDGQLVYGFGWEGQLTIPSWATGAGPTFALYTFSVLGQPQMA